jgi:molybdenum cofactor biosynthesis enzyme MoaA
MAAAVPRKRVLPPIIDVEFTAHCNLKCGFCFGPVDDHSTRNLPTEFWLQALGWLRQYGVQGIVISGGEPTIHPDIVSLLRHAKGLGLSIVLTTHGRFSDRVLRCAPYCDWIAVPVDGVTVGTLAEMRGSPWGLADATALISAVRADNPAAKIKLGTVATRKNRHEIPLLGRQLLLTDIGIDTWKVYQYTPRRKSRARAAEFRLCDAEYDTLCRDIASVLTPDPRFSVVFSSNESRRQAYVFLYSDGAVVIPNVGEDMSDIFVGNLYLEGMPALDRVQGVILSNHLGNYRNTYGTSTV